MTMEGVRRSPKCAKFERLEPHLDMAVYTTRGVFTPGYQKMLFLQVKTAAAEAAEDCDSAIFPALEVAI